MHIRSSESKWSFFLAPLLFAPILPLLSPVFYHDDVISGHCEESFLPVFNAFQKNFEEGLEREGAAVAVFHKGKRMADLWGGFADRSAGRKWTHNTRTVLFSATKAISALTIAVLVDRGLLSYEDRLVDFWPEYGRHGKENTTVEHVMSHMAGIPYLDDHVDMEHLTNFEELERNMENSKPKWEPGSGSGYHPVTFGFLVDAIVRRTDERKRDLATFFHEEIAKPYGLSSSIGVSREEVPWLARITQPSLWEYIRDIIKNPKIIPMLALMYARPDEMVQRIRTNPDWLVMNFDTVSINNPDIASLPMGAVTGASNAESLARMFSLMLNGELISNHTLELLLEPTVNSWQLEKVVLWPVAKGRGFFYERHPSIPGAFTFGHPGYGGQFIHVDPAQQLVIAYIANGLKTGTGELCGTYMRLQEAAYGALKR